MATMLRILSYALVFAILPALAYYALLRSQSSVAKSLDTSACRDAPELPQTFPVLGIHHFWRTLKLRQSHQGLKTLAGWHVTYGNTFKVRSLGKTVYHTWNPDNLKAIFGTKWKDWGTGRFVAMEPFCGRGFVTTDGEEWRGHRALLAPNLTEASAVDLDALDVAYRRYISPVPADGTEVDLAPVFDELFLDLSCQFLFGRQLSSLGTADAPVDIHTFQRAFNTSQFWMGMRLAFGPVGRAFSSVSKSWKESCTIVHSFVDHYIQLTLEEVSNEAETKDLDDGKGLTAKKRGKGSSLLQSLAVQKIDPLEIRGQIIQGMLVTQDTTGIVLSNTIFLLSREPTLWARLREDVATLGPIENWNTGDLTKLTFLQNIIKESLRLHPLFASNSRVAVTDTVLPKGGGTDGSAPIFIPAGSRVSTSFYTLHRQTHIFGRDVAIFNPDRWDTISPDGYEFMPFSHGPRGCAGKHKALGEASYIIARMASEIEMLESRDGRPWTEDVKLVVKNLNGCWVAMRAA